MIQAGPRYGLTEASGRSARGGWPPFPRARVLCLAFRTILAAAMAGLLTGCLFTTRDPQPPSDEQQVEFRNPTEMPVVLDNVRRTLEAKSVTNYDRSLAGDFVFVPDPADASIIGEGRFDDWKKDDEVSWMGTVLQAQGDVTFTWTPQGDPLFVPGGTQSEQYYEDILYSMRFSKTVEGAVVDTVFSGKADLYMREASGLWTIYEWLDKRDGSSNQTLGMVRNEGSVVY